MGARVRCSVRENLRCERHAVRFDNGVFKPCVEVDTRRLPSQ